ncbi:hypothetical protein IMZ48_20550 [Candidatus Bathyarchaeota archaeon]|nr:hypothetical protein [Candidatus Bathyarchaeota archaeon]
MPDLEGEFRARQDFQTDAITIRVVARLADQCGSVAALVDIYLDLRERARPGLFQVNRRRRRAASYDDPRTVDGGSRVAMRRGILWLGDDSDDEPRWVVPQGLFGTQPPPTNLPAVPPGGLNDDDDDEPRVAMRRGLLWPDDDDPRVAVGWGPFETMRPPTNLPAVPPGGLLFGTGALFETQDPPAYSDDPYVHSDDDPANSDRPWWAGPFPESAER